MAMNVQTLKGFRDFLPLEKRKRDYVRGKVIEIFERFGFEPLETPTLEYASLLLGKYGEEADKLVYTFEDRGERKVGLRYDQTVPTARVLAQYTNELPRFFRRYQIQNVFRADKPQKGRFREFTQCDIDIFGTTSPLADAEILSCTYFAFKNVGYANILLKVNDRQVLIATLKPFATEAVSVFSIIQSIDKLDKQTKEEVATELVEKGISSENAQKILESITAAKLSENLQTIIDATKALGVPEKDIAFTPTLARGLDYYTGMIFEVMIPEYGVGSCGGGGRYDNLIGELSGNSIPAVGVGMGFDRMVEAADTLGLFPKSITQTAQVLVTVFSKELEQKSLEVSSLLRSNNISTELWVEPNAKLDKQFKYADEKGIPFAVIIGPEEAEKQMVTVKNLQTREQTQVTISKLPGFFQEKK